MDGIEGRLAVDLSREEKEFGFSVGTRAAVRELRPGLLAVKIRATDGATEYAICNSGDP